MKAIKEINEFSNDPEYQESYVIYKNGKKPDYIYEDTACVLKVNGRWRFSDNNEHSMYYSASQLMDIAKFMKKLEKRSKRK